MAASRRYAAVLCLGAVIRGETTHDQHINRAVSTTLAEIGVALGVPVLFGVLTCNTLEQAIARWGGRPATHGKEAARQPRRQKGIDCADAAVEMVDMEQNSMHELEIESMSNTMFVRVIALSNPPIFEFLHPHQPMSRRSRAREVALQVLFQEDLNPGVNPATADDFVHRRLAGWRSWSSFREPDRRGAPQPRGARTACCCDRRQLGSRPDGRHGPQRAALGRSRCCIPTRPTGWPSTRPWNWPNVSAAAIRPNSSTASWTGNQDERRRVME